MPTEHWGAIEDENSAFALDKYVPSTAKKPKLDEIQQNGELMPVAKHHTLELKSSIITQTIEVIKQSEVLQSLIDTYSNTNGISNYLLNPCQMIPEVDFPPENAADLISEQKFEKPIWFIPTVDTAYSRGDPQPCPEISSNTCRHVLRKSMCGLLRLAGFTDSSEMAVLLLTDAAEEFMRSLIARYRNYYDTDDKLRKSTMMRLVPLERAYFSKTGTSLTQVHNYYKHKVVTRNRAEIAEFNSVLQEYDKLMKESQASMQKHQLQLQQQQQLNQQHEFNGHDFLNILEMQPGEDGSSANGSNSMTNIVGEMLQELGGSTNSSISLSNVSNGQHQMLNSNALYGLLDGHASNAGTNLVSCANTSSYQPGFDS